MKARICESPKSAPGSPRANCTYRLNDIAPISMNTVPTYCAAGEKPANELSWLPMPPVASVVIACTAPSKADMPDHT